MKPQSETKKILVVEDDPDMLDLIVRTLEGEHDVSTVSWGGKALGAIRQFKPHLVILDVHVPDVHGLEICGQVKSDPALAHTPVLMLTSREDVWTKNRAKEAGANIFMNKPFVPSELLAAVRQLIR